MELGNLIGAGLIFSQFLSEKPFSMFAFIVGFMLMGITYVVSYVISP